MEMAPGRPTSLRVAGGCGNEGSGMVKVRSHSPSSSSFRSWLRAQDAGEVEKAGEMKANGQVSPNNPPFPAFIHQDGRIRRRSPNPPH